MSNLSVVRHLQARRHQAGQTLAVIAVILPFLLAFILTAVEISGRILQKADVEDALQQATRAAAQMFDYAAFAQNQQRVRSDDEIIAFAKVAFTQNLRHVGGLREPAATVAGKVEWTILRNGGTCTFGTRDSSDDLVFQRPALCAVLRAPLKGMPFIGSWDPIVRGAATIEEIR